MIRHTIAYKRLRRQIQDLFDFVVVVCYAVPSLRQQIKAIRGGKASRSLLRPDYFVHDRSSLETVEKRAISYKSKLSSYVLISSFSFFEDYVKSVMREMIDFHGGDSDFIALGERRAKTFILSPSKAITGHKRKLQEPIKPAKMEKYEKYSKALVDLGYRFPTELLSAYGVRKLVEKASQLRAFDIPDLLQNGIHVELDDKTIETFHNIREIRNRIAHGEKVRLSLKKVMEMNRFLREFARNIDQHLVEHFFIIEKYA